jgi:GT2 family glycosyltransferase
MATSVSLITVNFNGQHFLDELFSSLARQSRPIEQVIFVDNASTDGSVTYVAEHFPWVEIVALAENVGFAEGNNIGLGHATGAYIALLNSDTMVEEHWLEELIRALESDSRNGAAVSKIYLANTDPPRLDCAGAEFNNLGFCWGRGANQIDRGQFERLEEVPALTACALILRRTSLNKQPLFDHQLFMYYEEFDLSLRVRGSGFHIVYAPKAIVYHKRSQSVKRADSNPVIFQQFYGNRNRVKILLKYYPASVLLSSLPLIGISLLYWNLVFLRHKGPRFFLSAIGAQLRYGLHGLCERSRDTRMGGAAWRPWMTRHTLMQVRALQATFQQEP